MRVIFVYTNEQSPQVSAVSDVTKIEESGTGENRVLSATLSTGGQINFDGSKGQIAILWE